MNNNRTRQNRPRKQGLRIQEEYKKTQDLELISKSVGIGVGTVRWHLKRAGVKFPRRKLNPKSPCSQNRDLVLRMAKGGATLAAIGRAIGSKGYTVHRFLRLNGYDRHFPVSFLAEKCSKWAGGRHIDKDGYVAVYSPNHPHRRKHTKYVLEHRLVMEKMIGRFLLPKEVVHHRDKNKQNNSPENLQLFSENSEHLAFELKGKVPNWTPEGRERILKGCRRLKHP